MTENIPLSEQTCANCGSTELRQDTNGVWHCLYCRSTFRADDPAMIVVDSPNVQSANKNVVDTADLFTFDQEQALSAHLRALSDREDVAVVVETVNTITQNVEMYARKRAHELGVGDAEKDNGIYILMVRQPRRVQVVAGNGIAPHLSGADITAIVQSVFIPTFKSGDLVKGLSDGATTLVEHYKANRSGRPSSFVPRTSASASRGFSGNSSSGSPFAGMKQAMGCIVFALIGVVLIFSFINGLNGSGGGGGGGSDYGTSDNSWDWDSGGGSDWGGGGSDYGGGGFDSGSSGGGDW